MKPAVASTLCQKSGFVMFTARNHPPSAMVATITAAPRSHPAATMMNGSSTSTATASSIPPAISNIVGYLVVRSPVAANLLGEFGRARLGVGLVGVEAVGLHLPDVVTDHHVNLGRRVHVDPDVGRPFFVVLVL